MLLLLFGEVGVMYVVVVGVVGDVVRGGGGVGGGVVGEVVARVGCVSGGVGVGGVT